MPSIPVTLTDNGKNYQAELSEVLGAGANVWHLSINNYYRGVLTFTSSQGWQFSSQKGWFPEWAEVLSKAVMEAEPEREFKRGNEKSRLFSGSS